MSGSARGVHAVFHYVPLHTSPAGSGWADAQSDLRRWGRRARLVRLPLWAGMGDVAERVLEAVHDAVGSVGRRGLTSARG